MKRIRKIKKWGNTCVIVLHPIDMKDLGFKVDDEIDISGLEKAEAEQGEGEEDEQ